VIEYGLVTCYSTIEFDSVKSGGCPPLSDSRLSSFPCSYTIVSLMSDFDGADTTV
jgi:hypothetical protein